MDKWAEESTEIPFGQEDIFVLKGSTRGTQTSAHGPKTCMLGYLLFLSVLLVLGIPHLYMISNKKDDR